MKFPLLNIFVRYYPAEMGLNPHRLASFDGKMVNYFTNTYENLKNTINQEPNYRHHGSSGQNFFQEDSDNGAG